MEDINMKDQLITLPPLPCIVPVVMPPPEIPIVVVDMDARTLTYWRDGQFLGMFVIHLPRSGHLYPVVVPFNASVSMGIMGMDGEPLS
eukprot:7759648-Ditylum_brightwellii.AAC.1